MKKYILSIIALVAIISSAYSQGNKKSFPMVINGSIYNAEYALLPDEKIQLKITGPNNTSDSLIIPMKISGNYDQFQQLFEGILKNDTNLINGKNTTEKVIKYNMQLQELFGLVLKLPLLNEIDSLNGQLNEVGGGLTVQTYIKAYNVTKAKEDKKKTDEAEKETKEKVTAIERKLSSSKSELTTLIGDTLSNNTEYNNALARLEVKRDSIRLVTASNNETNSQLVAARIANDTTNAKALTSILSNQNSTLTALVSDTIIIRNNLLLQDSVRDASKTRISVLDTFSNNLQMEIDELKSIDKSSIKEAASFVSGRSIFEYKEAFKPNNGAAANAIALYEQEAQILDANISCVYNLVTMGFRVKINNEIIELKTKYPIATKTDWKKMYVYGSTHNGNEYRFRINDLVKFGADSASKNKFYNWQGFDSKLIHAGETYKVTKKNWLTEAMNFTAFYDVLSQIRAAKDNRNNDVPVQMELNFNIPMFDWNANRAFFAFPKMEISVNAVPAGEKAAPFHLLDSASIYRTGKRSINFELLRDHYMNNAVKFTVFRLVPTSREYMFFDFNAGFRSFLTNVKTRDLLDLQNNKATNDSILAGEDVRATSFLIGPELGLRYECVFDKWFGADISFNTTYLRRPVGVKRDLENLLEDYQYPGSKYYSRDMWTISPEVNLYFRIGKESKNPSGFMFRYRLYKDLLSAANPVHFILIGYAANLKTMFK